MSVPDAAMGIYLRLASRWTPQQIEKLEKDVASGVLHPRDAKMSMALEITSIFYGDEESSSAQENFIKTFQQKEIPDDIPEYSLKDGQSVLDVILEAKMAVSKSEARRLFDQKGVRLDGETLERGEIAFPHPGVLQVGKRRFLRVK